MVFYRDIFRALNRAGVRYLVAGGVALNLHQVMRATVDLDLIVHLEQENILKFVEAMKKLGYVPKVPVRVEEFADQKKRESWILDKGMIVFSFINPNNPMEVVDIFVREPRPFGDLYKRRKEVKAFDTLIPILSVDDLIDLKQDTGRDRDEYDVKMLKKLYGDKKSEK